MPFGSPLYFVLEERINSRSTAPGTTIHMHLRSPLIVNGILDHYVAQHLPKQNAYPVILHIMTGLLVLGFLCNLLVRPVAEKYWMKEQPEQTAAAAH